jgi:biopolymer transport protein ExbD
MRFPRSIKPFRGQLEIAPFLSVAFLLAVLLLFGSSLVFTPGIPIHLPDSAELPGTSNPTVSVVVDAEGSFYYENQIIDEPRLKEKLAAAVEQSNEPLTLVVQFDKKVAGGTLARLGLLARSAGIKDALMATRPQVVPVAAAHAP